MYPAAQSRAALLATPTGCGYDFGCSPHSAVQPCRQHVRLACRMPLDVLRVDTEDMQHRFAVCVASYGYMGDLMKDSEKLRWMGPARYNVQGAITLFRGRSYSARVSWLPAPLP